MALAGYCLRKAGLPTQLTPSQLLTTFLPDIPRLRLKLMHLRIMTISDVMIFQQNGSNTWDRDLVRNLGLTPEVLPVECPPGYSRQLRVGQFWATSNYGGPEGFIVEIMGLQHNRFNGS
jgi:hypothetical protein